MKLYNKQVTHKIFGRGEVVQHDNSYIQVEFTSGVKKFVYPDAFDSYLTLNDQSAVDFVKIAQRKRRKEKMYNRIKKMQAMHSRNRRRFLEQKSAAQNKINPRSQAVFWCKDHEIEKIFTEWSIFTGAIKSGRREGEPRRLAQISQNSTVLLTARDTGGKEKNRRILGIFMVGENFNTAHCKDGYIPAHSEYRLNLTEVESKKMLFWNYYVNKKYPARTIWNTGRYRYFDNKYAAQILRDIIALRKGQQGKAHAQRFFEYFCQMNMIDTKELSEPEGALMKQRAEKEDKGAILNEES